MNKVGLPLMDAVVVALVTQGYAVGGGTLNWDTTSDTRKGDFLTLVLGGAFPRTKPFHQVGFPTAVGFFGDVFAAHLARLQFANRYCHAGFISPVAKHRSKIASKRIPLVTTSSEVPGSHSSRKVSFP